MKIYNGMRSEKSLVEVISELVEYRKTIKPYYPMSDLRKLKIENRMIYDRLKNEPESTIQLIPAIDNEIPIVLAIVMPQDTMNIAKNMNDGKILNDIEQHTSLTSFGYWNNSDQPDGISDDEWLHRADIYNSVIDNAAIKVYGVTFFLCDFNSLVNYNN